MRGWWKMSEEWKDGWIVAQLGEFAEPSVFRISYRVDTGGYKIKINHLMPEQFWSGIIFPSPTRASKALIAEAKIRLDELQASLALAEGEEVVEKCPL